MKHAPAFLAGMLVGSAAAAAFGWWMVPTPVERRHQTLPRPSWTEPAPQQEMDPLEHRIPPQQLPTR